MKIVHIITGLNTGGAEWALYNILNGGLADRYENHIISLKDEGAFGELFNEIGVPVTSLDIFNGSSLFNGIKKVKGVINNVQPNIIQGWMYHGNLVASLAMIFSTKRSLLGWNIRHTLNQLSYEALLTQYVIRLNKFYSKEPEILLYNSYRSKKIHEAFGLCANNGTVIPNGIDIEKFQYSSKARKHLRNILGISLNSFVVGHAARFHPMKNHSLAIKVMVRFAMSNPKVQFIFVGRDITWENEKITTLILPSVRAQFHLLGERKDMPAIYNTLDLFLSTSSYGEGFPNVIGEAMSTGVPCVATDVGDCKLIIGKTGIIVPTNDAIAITSGIVKIFARLLNNRISFREITRKRIETNFSLKSIVDRYADLYAKKMHYYKT